MTDLTARELLLMLFEIAQQTVENGVGIQSDATDQDRINLAMQAVHEAADFEGLSSFLHQAPLQGDAAELADRLYASLGDAEPGIHIWCADIALNQPGSHGVGGPDQTMALSFAEKISSNNNLHLLAGSMSGIDGNSNCAGAVVSMYTRQKAEKMGFDIMQEIKKSNAGLVLMATDDLISGICSNIDSSNLVIVYKTAE